MISQWIGLVSWGFSPSQWWVLSMVGLYFGKWNLEVRLVDGHRDGTGDKGY